MLCIIIHSYVVIENKEKVYEIIDVEDVAVICCYNMRVALINISTTFYVASIIVTLREDSEHDQVEQIGYIVNIGIVFKLAIFIRMDEVS